MDAPHLAPDVVHLTSSSTDHIERLLEDLRKQSPPRGVVLVVMGQDRSIHVMYTGFNRLELMGAVAAALSQLWVAPQLQ